MTDTDNKRHVHRIFYNANVTLSDDSGKTVTCQLVDISLNGCLLNFDSPWSGETDVIYTLNLNLSSEVNINMQVSVAHAIGNNAGFKCEHIDIDSISQLRRLVELNLGDSEVLERDLLALTHWQQ